MSTSLESGKAGSIGSIRICHVISGLETGGAEMMLLKLVVGLSEQGIRSEVVSLRDEGTIGPMILDAGVPVHSLGLFKAIDLPAAAARLIGVIRRVRPHVLQGWMYHGNLAASLGAPFVARPPLIWGIRQTLYDVSREKPGTAAVIRLGAPLSHRSPARILYNSRVSATQHEARGYDASRTSVVPNGFDCAVLRPDPEARGRLGRLTGIGDDATIVGMIARYHPMKNHAGFLRAAALAVRDRPELRFVLIGKNMDHSNAELATDLGETGLRDRVVLLGHRNDAAALSAGLDVATLSSSWGEGFPNVIGEAMASGVPCAVTDVGDAGWVVGDTGLVVPPGDPSALAAAWIELCDRGPEGRHALGRAARQRIEDHFSLQSVVREYCILYESLLHPSAEPASRVSRWN